MSVKGLQELAHLAKQLTDEKEQHLAEIVQLRTALATARAVAMEECAKVAQNFSVRGVNSILDVMQDIAADIRTRAADAAKGEK